ncbi:MAG TPA: Uma2 family endonuclease [Isosphaeraceae bacterium]|nr:Uma2 family endonuclease [Isosphaeraceae bacterium]
MATISQTPPETAQGEDLVRVETFLLQGVSWGTYESLLRDFERSGSNLRMTYDRGSLELMSPAKPHERPKKRIGRMIECITEELNIPVESGGSLTFRKPLKERGLEPDECYWISHEASVSEQADFDFDRDPPPDLAIEVENTSTILDRLPILAALGFPEIWRVTEDSLLIGRLQNDGTYTWGDRSEELPFVSIADLQRWLPKVPGQNETAWIRAFRAWVRAELAPRFQRPD